jgi:cell division protein FtsI/penicillin-binding protein 2
MLCLAYFGLACRLVYLQVYRHRHYFEREQISRLRPVTIVASRGAIVDRNGAPLAISVEVGDIIANPHVITSPEQTSELLQTAIGLDPTTELNICNEIVNAKLRKTRAGNDVKYLPLVADVSYSRVTDLQNEMQAEKKAWAKNPSLNPDYLAGISIVQHQSRTYPNGDIAAQILGFPKKGEHGEFTATYGLESSQQALLAGTNGISTTETDNAGQPIPGTSKTKISVTDGKDISLTIDLHIQEIAQTTLYNMVSVHHAQSGSVVVLDPKTGDILAIANYPIFDPNNIAKSNYSEWDNRAVSDLYEPGSTLKTLTLAAVLDSEGLAAADRRVYCTGQLKVGGHTIHCAPDPPDYGVHGSEDMQDVLRNSCNIGACIYGMSLGPDKLYQYQKAFGLFDRPECGLPGAQRSRLTDPEIKPWSKIELADVSFGQGISLTGLQLASVYATIANNGVRVFPHIVLGQKPPEAPYQVVKPDVAQKILTMLRAVVTSGTGTPAQIADYTVGGKTGSAQVAEKGHYGDQYIGSFCGVAPLSNPRLVVLCVINKPVGVHWGAVVAAPVVHDILEQSLWYLKVPPDAPEQLDSSAIAKAKITASVPMRRIIRVKKHLRHINETERFG